MACYFHQTKATGNKPPVQFYVHLSAVLNWNPAYHPHVLLFVHLLANMPYKENLSPVLLPANQKKLWKLALDNKWANV